MFETLPNSNLQDVDSKARESDMQRKTTDGRWILSSAVVVGLLSASVITQADDPSSRKRTRQQSDRDEKASPLRPKCLERVSSTGPLSRRRERVGGEGGLVFSRLSALPLILTLTFSPEGRRDFEDTIFEKRSHQRYTSSRNPPRPTRRDQFGFGFDTTPTCRPARKMYRGSS